VIKKAKILKIKRQSTNITHLLQCALEFQSDHAPWYSKGERAGMCPGAQTLEVHQHTLFRHKKRIFQ